MTSPPPDRRAVISARKGWGVEAIVWLFDPFQARVQDVLDKVSRNARVRYRSPDCWARVAMLSAVHASKYGANTWAGRGVAAIALVAPRTMLPITAAAATATRRRRCTMPEHLRIVARPPRDGRGLATSAE